MKKEKRKGCQSKAEKTREKEKHQHRWNNRATDLITLKITAVKKTKCVLCATLHNKKLKPYMIRESQKYL